MKNPVILLAMISVFFASCQKIVIIDLNTKDPKPVVEANVLSIPGPYLVKLTTTANYYDSNIFPAISGAGVVITDNAGNSETLTETSPGNYKTSTLIGTMGRTYTLTFTANGKSYSANSTMPYNVPIDSVIFQKSNGGGGPGGGNPTPTYRVMCKFKDPVGISNYYMLQVVSNDSTSFNQANFRVTSDKLIDGQAMSITDRTRFNLNDTVIVNLKCIDKSTYDFYNTLPNAIGSDNQFLSSLPANPTNNISNGGLGYFSAYSISSIKVVVH